MLVFDNTCNFFILINLLNFLLLCRQDYLSIHYRIAHIRTGKHCFQHFKYIAFLSYDRDSPMQIDMFDIEEEREI